MRARQALLAVMLLAGAARLWLAAATPLIYDEYQWLRIADTATRAPLHIPWHGDQHPPAAAWLAALGSFLLGPNLIGYRLGALLLGTALIPIAFRLGTRAFGERAGLLAAVLVALNEYLFGVSRLATEKCYLAFAAAAVLLFLRAVEGGRRGWYVAAGAAFGLGLLSKQTLVLWAPLLAFELLRRRGKGALWSAGPWLGILTAAAIVFPDIVWNLLQGGAPASPSERGLLWQVGRLGVGWSLAPLALYLRPLQYTSVEAAVSEYASMTTLPGLLLLGGAAASLYLLRSTEARLLQALGWTPVLFFMLLGHSGGGVEFWWADLSVVPFAVLTAGVLARIPHAGFPWLVALGVAVPPAVGLVRTEENCYAASWPAHPPAALSRCQESQRALIVRFRERDHAALTRLGGWRLPAAAFYADSLQEYAARLTDDGGTRTFPAQEEWPAVPAASRAAESAWAGRERDRILGP